MHLLNTTFHFMLNYYFLLLMTLLAVSSRPKEPVRIMAVGDSITQGGRKTQAEHTYRLPLQRLLLREGIRCDFIGSRQRGLDSTVTWPEVAAGVSFDPDHEGYYGHKTADVVGKVKEAFSAYQSVPDIVLVHLGTNDQKGGDFETRVGQPLKDLITLVRHKNPRTVFLLGHLNFNGSPAADQIRVVVEKVAAGLTTSRSPVRTVHHYRNWYENPDEVYSDTYDWAHPNLKGQEKMALNWFEAMEPFLKKRKQARTAVEPKQVPGGPAGKKTN